MENRRRLERTTFEQQAEIRLHSVSSREDLEGGTLTCRIIDISPAGLRLVLPGFIPVETQIRFQISITDPPASFTHEATVRWITRQDESRYAVGLEFTSATDTHTKEWQRLVRRIKHAAYR